MTAPSNANTSGPVEKPAHMSDELFEVWRKIKPGPDYAPYRIEAAEKAARDANDRATAAEARADRLAKALERIADVLSSEPFDRDAVIPAYEDARAALKAGDTAVSNEAPTDALRLVPCPFCGGDVINTRSQEMTKGPAYYWHKCETCGAESEGDYGEDVAVAAWNRRAAPASPLPGGGDEALIAELKEARGLLKPFAVYYDINDLDERAADDTIEVPVGDLRLARAFLARNGKGEE